MSGVSAKKNKLGNIDKKLTFAWFFTGSNILSAIAVTYFQMLDRSCEICPLFSKLETVKVKMKLKGFFKHFLT